MAMSRNHDDLLNHFLHHALSGGAGEGTDRRVRPISIDVLEKENHYEMKADIPGVNKSDINLTVDNDVLSIAVEQKGEKEEKKEQEGVTWHRWERSSAFARRSIRMPDAADLHAIKAKYENGVLSLDIPKAAKARSHTVAIE